MKKQDLFNQTTDGALPPTSDGQAMVPISENQAGIVAKTEDMAALGFSIENNFAETGCEMRPQKIGIVSQAQMFKMPDDSKRDSLDGVIVYTHPCNAYWEVDMSDGGSGNPPDCASMDGIKPYTDKPIAPDCASCPKNKYGTGKDGQGKACKNMRRIYILIDGDIFPQNLSIPPTSLRAFDDFMSRLKRPYQTVKVRFTLAKVANKRGIEYSRIGLEVVDEINDMQALREISKINLILKRQKSAEITADEYMNDGTASTTTSDPF